MHRRQHQQHADREHDVRHQERRQEQGCERFTAAEALARQHQSGGHPGRERQQRRDQAGHDADAERMHKGRIFRGRDIGAERKAGGREGEIGPRVEGDHEHDKQRRQQEQVDQRDQRAPGAARERRCGRAHAASSIPRIRRL